MGIDYYQCSNCCLGISEEFCRIVEIEGYTPTRLCDNCRDYVLIAKPSDELYIPRGSYKFFAKSGDSNLEFDSLYDLEEHIEDNPESTFGIVWPKNMKSIPFIMLVGQHNINVLQDYCIKDYWNKLKHNERNEDNTSYSPTYEWLERELKNCEAELESLKEKRELLISLTKNKKQKC